MIYLVELIKNVTIHQSVNNFNHDWALKLQSWSMISERSFGKQIFSQIIFGPTLKTPSFVVAVVEDEERVLELALEAAGHFVDMFKIRITKSVVNRGNGGSEIVMHHAAVFVIRRVANAKLWFGGVRSYENVVTPVRSLVPSCDNL